MKEILKRFPQAILLLILFFAVACQEKEAMVYTSDNSVYFIADSSTYSFLDHGGVTRDTVEVRAMLIGTVSNQDRIVNVAVDNTDATEGTDFEIIRPVVMEKDSNFVSIKVVLYNTTTVKEATKHIWLSLQNSDDFTINEYSYPRLNYKLKFSGKVEKPDWWDTYFSAYTYSDTRMLFYIEVMGSGKSPSLDGIGYNSTAVIYLLRSTLAEYNATHAEPLSDEYGLLYW